MKTSLYHLQLNADLKANKDFYTSLFKLIDWEVIFEDPNLVGFKSENEVSVWLVHTDSKHHQNYDHLGLNHIALQVDELTDVDRIQKHLEERDITMLFGTPKHRPEFATSPEDTYYQIMFETPDRILFEVVYIGKK